MFVFKETTKLNSATKQIGKQMEWRIYKEWTQGQMDKEKYGQKVCRMDR